MMVRTGKPCAVALRLRITVLIGLTLVTAGLSRPLLQVAAWTGMVVTYSLRSPVRQAIRETFDGEHPCALCRVLRESAPQPRHAVALPAVRDIAFAYVPVAAPWGCPGADGRLLDDIVVIPTEHSTKPPVPPPRA